MRGCDCLNVLDALIIEKEIKMKKSLVAAVLTIGLVGNAFAACDSAPYIAPEDMKVSCSEETPTAQVEAALPADQTSVSGTIEANSMLITGAT